MPSRLFLIFSEPMVITAILALDATLRPDFLDAAGGVLALVQH